MRLMVAFAIYFALITPLAAAGCDGLALNFEARDIKIGTIVVRKSRFHDDQLKASNAYLVRDDQVLAMEPEGNWVCAAFIGPKGVLTLGFLKSTEVNLSDVKPISLNAWLGDWTTGKWQNLTLRRGSKLGWIGVQGSAFWSLRDVAELDGGVHSGGIDGEAPLEENRVGFTRTDDGSYQPYSAQARENFKCAIQLQLLSQHYLMVEDSGMCGGANVRFTGFYGRGKVDELKE